MYSDWLKDNPNAMSGPQQQPAMDTYSSQLSSPMTTQQPAPVAQPVAQQSGGGAQKAQAIAGAVMGQQQPRQNAQIQLRESAYSEGPATQSDAPNAQGATPMKSRGAKIMQIIGAIFTMGASAAAAKGNQQQGGNTQGNYNG